MTVNVQFGDYLQLETAFRAGILFKFSGDHDAEVFLGSPVMAEALNRMLDAMQEYWKAAGKAPRAKEVRDWYVLSKTQLFVDVISSYALRHPKWAAMTRHEQLDRLEVIAAPYRLDDAGVALFEHILKQ